MFIGQLKTFILLLFLGGILLFFGEILGGRQGVTVAFGVALVINLLSYFYSDKIVLALYGAKPVSRDSHPELHEIVEELAENAGIPAPKIYLIDNPSMANAFATGRGPSHAAVAVTTGILNLLDRQELRGVLAHELAHVKHRDILVSTLAATVAMAISWVSDVARWTFLLSGSSGKRRGNSGIILLISAIVMPIAALLIRLAISRSREFLADEGGAKISHDPLALASALEKLHSTVKAAPIEASSSVKETTSSLFIVNPFSGSSFLKIFSTHPPVEERIRRLRKMAGISY